MIEIEKKFLLTNEQQEQLLEGARVIGSKRVEDAYFDMHDYRLTTHDLWFRLRDGVYELKAPLKSGSGSYAKTNRFHEITDLQEIARELNLPDAPDFESALSLAGIERFMICYTDRTSYDKQGFRIDIDSASFLDSDFHYSLAEIELLIEDEAEADEADRRIVEFAKQFDLTTDEIVLGKVAVYLKADRPEHYAALVAAGILK